ncbi:polysaccharide export outer membrane protein [Albimonas donghaensis]|uniref:Polysaccharide export outer membrane protein n=1 Tax=Albimonas donghaensis TaxID=356660 RepID=A0A1H2WNP8_9RHOB|nr:polysaccharide biosynthesis/export family protein [Albimonas donghaensis]SDW82283.1 polysaccharide export outer membrane protein [Albimonas donghaensis]
MPRFAFLALALVAALTISTSTGLRAQTEQSAQSQASSSAATAAELAASSHGSAYYSVRPGDTLSVTVLEDPNLNRTVLVRPDGRISMPIAGTVMAAGNSPEQVEAALRQRLARGFQITPTVTVSVAGLAPILGSELLAEEEEEPYAYYLVGAFNNVGRIETQEELTLLTAIALAGGPTAFAAKDRIMLRRKDEAGVETVHMFDYERFEEGLPLEGDIAILPGDVIFAPERGLFD